MWPWPRSQVPGRSQVPRLAVLRCGSRAAPSARTRRPRWRGSAAAPSWAGTWSWRSLRPWWIRPNRSSWIWALQPWVVGLRETNLSTIYAPFYDILQSALLGTWSFFIHLSNECFWVARSWSCHFVNKLNAASIVWTERVLGTSRGYCK